MISAMMHHNVWMLYLLLLYAYWHVEIHIKIHRKIIKWLKL